MKKYRRQLALALCVLAAVVTAELAGTFGLVTGAEAAEDALLDFRERLTPETFQPGLGERESQVVLVLFDEFSVMDSVAGWPWLSPFPRVHIAKLVDALSAAGARTIGLDVYLDKLFPKLDVFGPGDSMLRDAIQRAGNVVLVAPITETDSGSVLSPPHPYFADVAAAVGTAELPASFDTFRDGTLAARSGARLVPSFALALMAQARGFDVDSLLADAKRTGRIGLPGLPDGVGRVPSEWWEPGSDQESTIVPFRIRYLGPPSGADAGDPPGTFQATASSAVVSMAENLPFLLPEYFQDKIVLVGTGFHDSDKFRTPFYSYRYEPPPAADGEAPSRGGPYEWMYGVEVHANTLQNMLDGTYVRPMSAWAELVILVLVASVAGGVSFWKRASWGGGATALLALGVLVSALWLWDGGISLPGVRLPLPSRFLWMPIVTPLIAMMTSYLYSVAYVSLVEGKEKRFIKGAFGKFVSPEVVAEIAEHPETLQLGGQKRELTLLFSDLAGFTTLSEEMDPHDLILRLNEYLSEMTEVVLHEGGTLDKYIGDAIMAFWNAPKAVDDHADRALRTAVLMQRKMADLNARWRERDADHQEMLARIGVNTGPAVVGNVGGENRFDYSAIGDPVNLAARLEPANKSYDTLTMASQFTVDAAHADAFRLRELDYIAVKGKIEPVTVYEVLEMAGARLPGHREDALGHFDAGFRAYKGRDWELAAKYFEAALEADPDDGPSRVYLGRAREYVAEPPPADWDFVVRRTVK